MAPQLLDGIWQKGSIITSDTKGAFKRPDRSFRDVISENHEKFKPESGRYHLYVSYACPWAHRTLIYRQLKSLDKHISVSVVHPDLLDDGWSFSKEFIGSTGDSLNQKEYLYEVYQMADKKVSTTVTVPVLWDKRYQTIVNNESSEIIRIFNDAFNTITNNKIDYYPEKFRAEIDEWNEIIYHNINNGVYKVGFARNQQAYDKAISPLFDNLERIDRHLATSDYLVGDTLTEADLRLIPTILRFDPVYFVHFKTNLKRIIDFPNLAGYTKRLCEIDAIKDTTNFEHIKRHYFYSHKDLNPHRIVPKGPQEFIGK